MNGALNILYYTNENFKVRFRDEIWIDSGEISLEIELISHQKETKVDLSKMNFGNFICILLKIYTKNFYENIMLLYCQNL